MSPSPGWSVRGRILALDRPLVMGILNVTPDSFSDGGRFSSSGSAVDQALRMLSEGADIIDVGGESTRPGANPVTAREELDRVLPVIEALARVRPEAVISIDTVKGEVARTCLDAGAHVVNDVSGLRLDPEIGRLCSERGAGLVLMHSRGVVGDMASYAHAGYDDVRAEVAAELRDRVETARASGVRDDQIAIDPGIGFAKKSEHSLAAMAAIPQLVSLGFPVLVGASRKRFIGEITGVANPVDRLAGTLGANVAALALGASIFRVHDVRPNKQALDVGWAILRGHGEEGPGKGSTTTAGTGEANRGGER